VVRFLVDLYKSPAEYDSMHSSDVTEADEETAAPVPYRLTTPQH